MVCVHVSVVSRPLEDVIRLSALIVRIIAGG